MCAPTPVHQVQVTAHLFSAACGQGGVYLTGIMRSIASTLGCPGDTIQNIIQRKVARLSKIVWRLRMRLVTITAVLLILGSGHSGNARDLSTACLREVRIGDATITCLKASVLLQREQLQLLRSIRDLLAQLPLRSVAVNSANSGRNNVALERIARLLEEGNEQSSEFLFVNDLRNVEGIEFDCPTGDCDEEARLVADQICQRLKFSAQHAFHFSDAEDTASLNLMQWIVCRR